jgi:hypothetical protein
MDNPKSSSVQRWMPVAASYVLLSVAFALISLTLTGFKYGVGNNIFHVPYVLRLSETKEFSGDAFYASLSNFTSIVWPILRTICNESNVREVFKWADFVSRASAFAGLLFLFRSFDLRTMPSMTLCLALAALSPWLQGNSAVGEHGMFINYFTQSEATWGFVFLSISLLALDKLPWSFAMTGIAFAINAFVGIWLLGASSLAIIATKRSIGLKTIVGSVAAFLLFAAPVAIWIATAVDAPSLVPKFSYIHYIRQYYPNHFLIEAATSLGLTRFALLFAIGLLAALFAPNRRFWLAIQAALALVFLIGIPLPYILDNRFVFNLHLLRSAGLEQAVAIALSIAAGARFIFVLRDYRSQTLGLVIAFSLILMGQGVVGLLIVFLALFIVLAQMEENRGTSVNRGLVLIRRHVGAWTGVCVSLFVFGLLRQVMQQHFAASQLASLAVVAIAFAVMLLRYASVVVRRMTLALVFLFFASAIAARSIIWPVQDPASGRFDSTHENRSWLRFTDEIRVGDIHGVFLVPVGDEFEGFQLQARKLVWVGWKQGAAVMWSPSFYRQWMPRYAEVSELKTPENFVNYAKKNGIHNLVVKTEKGGCPPPSTMRMESPPYLLCQL